jgi:hypothetical protein
MPSFGRILALSLAILAAAPALGKPAAVPAPPAAAEAPWPEAWFEIFKLAPGRQEAFMRMLAQADEVSRAGGQPPVQIFVHQSGADWDVLVFKPEPAIGPTPEQEAAMAAKHRELGLPSGPAYFVAIRELVASHEDTKTYGPLSAAQWLARLGSRRAGK